MLEKYAYYFAVLFRCVVCTNDKCYKKVGAFDDELTSGHLTAGILEILTDEGLGVIGVKVGDYNPESSKAFVDKYPSLSRFVKFFERKDCWAALNK